MMPLRCDGFLRSLFSQPTAPFRESHVARVVINELKRARLPHFSDPTGNIILGAASRQEYVRLVKERSNEPLRIFMAHMDHPGFHGIRWLSPTRLEIEWYGGSPTQRLEGARVWVADSDAPLGEGHLISVKMTESGRAIKSGVIELPLDDRRVSMPNPELLFGGFAFHEPVWEEGDLIFTRAADDLAGVFSIVSLAVDLFHRKLRKRPPFLGLLTRAEEVGFIGAIQHFDLGWLEKPRRPLLVVSLEASRALPGAEIGKGPIVRLGDRATVFDPGALRVFSELAQKILPDRHQKRIMDGGSCEATAATAYGLPSVGISVPLGNYHNQSFEGGTDSMGPLGPAPEFIHHADLAGMFTLCKALMQPKLPWAEPWAGMRRNFRANLRKYKRQIRLNLTPDSSP